MVGTLAERFWAKVQKGPECWEWAGAKSLGYGYIQFEGKAKKAAHVAIFLTTGEWPRHPTQINHHCDNKGCVRISHLYLGTQKENIADLMARHPTWKPFRSKSGAPVHRRGENHYKTKLSSYQVEKIRTRYARGGILLRELAKHYGSSISTIGKVIQRKTWK